MSFLKYLQEDFGQASGALATTVSNEMQPDYNNTPKAIPNPYERVLADALLEPFDMNVVIKIAKYIKDQYNHITREILQQVLRDNNLELKSNNPKAFEMLFNKLGMTVAKFR